MQGQQGWHPAEMATQSTAFYTKIWDGVNQPVGPMLNGHNGLRSNIPILSHNNIPILPANTRSNVILGGNAVNLTQMLPPSSIPHSHGNQNQNQNQTSNPINSTPPHNSQTNSHVPLGINSRSSSTPPVNSNNNSNQTSNINNKSVSTNSNSHNGPTQENININQNSQNQKTINALHSSQNSTISFENNIESTVTRRSSHTDIPENMNVPGPGGTKKVAGAGLPVSNHNLPSHAHAQNLDNKTPHRLQMMQENVHSGANTNAVFHVATENNNNNQQDRFQFKKYPNRRIQNPASTILYTAIDIHGNSVFNNNNESRSSSVGPQSLPLPINHGPQTNSLWNGVISQLNNSYNTPINLADSLEDPNQIPSDSLVRTPWILRETVYKTGSEGLAEEIIDFVNYIKTTPEEIYMRRKIIGKIKKVVKELFPVSKLKVFGSFRTGLYWVGFGESHVG